MMWYETAKPKKIINFPNWKHSNCSVPEKLREVAQYLESHPEDMQDLIIIWTNENNAIQYESDSKTRLADAIFALEEVKFQMLR